MSQKTPPLLQIKNLSISFKTEARTIEAVKKISFDVFKGETVCLVGESGSGKSVSALSILKLLPYPKAFHPSGEILFEGENLLDFSPEKLRRIRGNDIAMIFQEPLTALNPLHTLERQISEVLELHTSLTGDDLKNRVFELLESVGFADGIDRLKAFPHELSGGQRQRVMIAMALAAEPKLLIADEPTTALDVTTQQQILDLLKQLQKKHNLAVLLITHDLNVVRRNADRVAVMQNGELVESATAKEIFANPKHAYTQELIAAEPRGSAVELPINPSPCLRAQDIKVYFPIKKGFFQKTVDYVRAVDNASLEIAQGETVGVVGESGSGKTTLALSLLRLQRLTQGTIMYQGTDIAQLSAQKVRPFRRHLQIVFQDPFGSLSPRMTAGDIIGEGIDVHSIASSAQEKEALVVSAMQEVQLDPDTRFRYPHEFSGGQRQRIAIARALVLNPDLLVLDEPTSALDRSVQASVLDLLKTLQKKHCLSYLFISHDLKVVRSIAHKIIVMKHGKIIESGPTNDVFQNPQNAYTKSLIQAAFV